MTLEDFLARLATASDEHEYVPREDRLQRALALAGCRTTATT